MSRDCVVRIEKLESSDAAYQQQCSQKTESVKQLTDTMQNVLEEDAADGEAQNEMVNVDDDVNSETSSDLYMVDVDETDALCDVDDNGLLAQTSLIVVDSVDGSAENTLPTISREQAADKLLSTVGASSAHIHTSRRFQPFVQLRRLDPAEIRRSTKHVRAITGHPDDSRNALKATRHLDDIRNAKSRYDISLSAHIISAVCKLHKRKVQFNYFCM